MTSYKGSNMDARVHSLIIMFRQMLVERDVNKLHLMIREYASRWSRLTYNLQGEVCHYISSNLPVESTA